MQRDFTIKKYKELCNAMKENYKVVPVLEYLLNHPEKAVILRHDVDVNPNKALEMALLENKLGISATYYFRTIPKIFKPEIIKKIHQLGHEVGYHYEVLDKVNGDFEKAIELFEKELREFREICDVKTICMHGNPLTSWDNRDLWKKYDFREYGIVGESYLSIDYNEVMYFTDTGRSWSGKYSLEDVVDAENPYLNRIGSTTDLTDLIRSKEIGHICILIHPKRWNDPIIPWFTELTFQSIKNVPKQWMSRVDQTYFLMTCDVESYSFSVNKEDPRIPKLIHKETLPSLLDLFSRYDVKSTFYFTGDFCEISPESIDLVKDHGHEIGCHGYNHDPGRAFDTLSYEEQFSVLRGSKEIIESVAGKIESFRAPSLRINEDTVRALEKTGFRSDSSISSQRFDGPFTFGARNKLKWLMAPRKPYFLSYDSVIREGDSGILEIPISAFILPYIGTTMRITPSMVRMLQRFLFFEAKKTEKPIVFLFHPNECLEVGDAITTTRRSKDPMKYLFADMIRHKLKLRNLGKSSLRLLDGILNDANKHGFEFLSVSEYRKKFSSAADIAYNNQTRTPMRGQLTVKEK